MMKEYRKTQYVINAEKVEVGTELHNYLEDCHYVTTEAKCIKLIGTAGEVWPITIEKLAKTYTFVDGTPITKDNIPKGVFNIATLIGKKADTVFAERVTEQVDVATSWGEILKANRDGIPHGNGDYIVYANKGGVPNPDDKWVVNGLIFPQTYVEV